MNNFDFSKLKFSSVRKNVGSRFIKVFYEKKNFALKLPGLRVPFDSKLNPYGKLEIVLSLGNNTELINKIKEFDEQMKAFAIENEWFSRDSSYNYSPMLRESANGKFPPLINLKVQVKDSEVQTKIYDESRKELSVDNVDDVLSLINKGVYIQTAIEPICVWFNSKNGEEQFGFSWKLSQMRITARPDTNVFDNTSDCDEGDSESDMEFLE